MAEDKSKMVDIDTSGDEVEIVLDEHESKNEKETKHHGEVREEVNVEHTQEESVSRETQTEDNLDDYSESVKRRIANLTKKYREAERQREEALKYAEGLKKQYEESQTKYSQLDKGYLSEFESRVTTQTEVVKDNLKRAIQARDADAIVKAQEQLAQLTLDNERLRATKRLEEEKASQPAPVTQQIQQPKTQQPPAQPDPKAERWARENAWFGQDEAMTYAAFGIHKKLIEEEGFDAQSDEYYNEINSRMRKEFPHKFSGEANVGKQSKPVQTVASAKRVNKDGRRSVRLTPSQVAIAKRLGVPLEEYARYVKEA